MEWGYFASIWDASAMNVAFCIQRAFAAMIRSDSDCASGAAALVWEILIHDALAALDVIAWGARQYLCN